MYGRLAILETPLGGWPTLRQPILLSKVPRSSCLGGGVQWSQKTPLSVRNPVARRLVQQPQGWAWGSFRHYGTGADEVVEIESHWTARRRERLDIVWTVRVRPQTTSPPKPSLDGAP